MSIIFFRINITPTADKSQPQNRKRQINRKPRIKQGFGVSLIAVSVKNNGLFPDFARKTVIKAIEIDR